MTKIPSSSFGPNKPFVYYELLTPIEIIPSNIFDEIEPIKKKKAPFVYDKITWTHKIKHKC